MFNVRKMEIDDLPSVWKLGVTELDMTKLYHQFWNLSELCEAMVNDSEFCLVAEEKCEIIGFAIGHRRFSCWREDLAFLEWLVVSKKHQNRGVGTLLCKELIEEFRKAGARNVLADIKADNEHALKFFKKRLFDECFTVKWLIRKL